MFCRQGFAANGAVWLLRARIGGSLNFDTAALVNPDGLAPTSAPNSTSAGHP